MDVISILRDHGVHIGTVRKGGGGLGNAYISAHTLPTTIESQKTWDVPIDVYDENTDTMMLYHNTGLLDTASWTLTGDAATGYQVNIPDNPETAIEDNNVIIVILRNAPSVPDSEDISGTRLTVGSVAMNKLGQDVQDKINNAATSVVIEPVRYNLDPANYPIGYSMFDVPEADVGDWLDVFGISAIDTTPYTILRVYTDRTSSYKAVQELVVVDNNSKLRYISKRTSIGSIVPAFEEPSIIYGIPDVEIVNDFTTGGADKAASAETVKILKTELDKVGTPNANGTVKINDNHAIRYFNFNAWANNTYSEHLRVHFPKVPFSGHLKLRLANGYTGEIVGGGSEFLYNISYVPDTEMLLQSFDILQTGIGVSAGFRIWQMGLRPVGDRRPYFTITKKRIKAPIYYELELITSSNNAFEILDAVSPENDSSSTSSDTTPEQQSIFTHVGNSKTDLATAITGKGVPTKADDTFAQMVANINAIKTSLVYSGTFTSPSGTTQFSYPRGGGAIFQPSLAVTGIPFKPKIIFAVSSIVASNSEISSTYVADDYGLGAGVARYSSESLATSALSNQITYMVVCMAGLQPNGTWNVNMAVPKVSRTYSIIAFG